MPKPSLLVNLASGFFTHPTLSNHWKRLESLAEVTYASCNAPDEILPYLKEADAVLMWSWPLLTAAMLDQAPRLAFSGNIDLSQEGARIMLARGIPVSLGRRGFSPAVAEMALTLILSTLRRTPTYHTAMHLGVEKWVKRFPDEIDPHERELSGRRVGIIGFGGIGQGLARLLAPFECDLQVFDPYASDAALKAHGARAASLEALASNCEVLVVCAASNPGSRHLLEARHLDAMPPGSVLVNVCRAALVDTDALLERLRRGDLFAALDVFDVEPLPADSELRRLPNVYLTPHRAGGTLESVCRILTALVDDYEAFLKGEPRRHALTEAMIPSLDG